MGYFIDTKQGRKGPYSTEKVLKLVENGTLKPQHKLIDESNDSLVLVSEIISTNEEETDDNLEVFDSSENSNADKTKKKERSHKRPKRREREKSSKDSPKNTRGSTNKNRGGSNKRNRGRSNSRPESSSNAENIVKAIGGIVIFLFIAFGISMCNKTSDKYDVRNAVHKGLVYLDTYDQNKNYYKKLVNMHHDKAFESSYSMGGRYRSAEFDKERYFNIIVPLMRDQAIRDGRTVIAQELTEVCTRNNIGQ